MAFPWKAALNLVGGFLGSRGGSTTTNVAPWGPTQSYLKDIFKRADMIGRGPAKDFTPTVPQYITQKVPIGKGEFKETQVLNPEYTRQMEEAGKGERTYPIAPVYQGPTSAPTNPLLNQYVDELKADPTGYNYDELSDEIKSTLSNFKLGPQFNKTLSGGYLDNPLTADAIQRAMNPIQENFRETVSPALMSAATSSGGNYFGSDTMTGLTAATMRNLGKSMADKAGDIAYRDRENERRRQHELVKMKGGMDYNTNRALAESQERLGLAEADEFQALQKLGLNNLGKAATLQQKLDQKQITDDYQDWQRTDPENVEYDKEMTERQAEWDELNKFAALLRGHGSQTTSHTPLSLIQKMNLIKDNAFGTDTFLNLVKDMWDENQFPAGMKPSS